MRESKAREFWIDSAPLFNGLDMYPYKKAFENIQDAEEKILGNTYHVIEYSAFQDLQNQLEDRTEKYKIAMDKGVDVLGYKLKKAVEALKVISQYTSAYSGASSPEANLAKETLRD